MSYEIDQQELEQQHSTVGAGGLSQDDFFNTLGQSTEGDHRPPPVTEPVDPKKEKEEEDALNDILGDSELLSDIAVEFVDLLAVQGCKAIAGEGDDNLFKVSDAKKNRIKKPLAILFERSKIAFNPWLIIFIMFVIAYAPIVSTAVEIKLKKEKDEKLKNGADAVPVVVKRGPGRPVGTTKENLQKNKE